MTPVTGHKQGWDKPLEVDWDFHLRELRTEISRYAPGKAGTLKQDLLRATTTTLNADETVITIKNEPPNKSAAYAKIQNFGGPAKDIVVKPVRAKALRFYWMGKLRFFKKIIMRKGQILGTDYVRKGVMEWARKLRSSRRVVSWANKHYSAPVGRYGRPSRSL